MVIANDLFEISFKKCSLDNKAELFVFQNAYMAWRLQKIESPNDFSSLANTAF